jgi:hypothetical protein
MKLRKGEEKEKKADGDVRTQKSFAPLDRCIDLVVPELPFPPWQLHWDLVLRVLSRICTRMFLCFARVCGLICVAVCFLIVLSSVCFHVFLVSVYMYVSLIWHRLLVELGI